MESLEGLQRQITEQIHQGLWSKAMPTWLITGVPMNFMNTYAHAKTREQMFIAPLFILAKKTGNRAIPSNGY